MIMTTSIQTSVLNTQSISRRRRASQYSVVVNGEDGNYREFEIEATSDTEAHRKANDIALQCMIDVTYVEVYKIA